MIGSVLNMPLTETVTFIPGRIFSFFLSCILFYGQEESNEEENRAVIKIAGTNIRVMDLFSKIVNAKETMLLEFGNS